MSMRKCDKCGKPGIVDGTCKDHAVKCKNCGCDIHYSKGVCVDCNDRYNDLITENYMYRKDKNTSSLTTYLYGIVCKKGVASNIVILPGSSPEKPIELAKSIANTSKSRIYCVESDIDVYCYKIKPYYDELPKHLQEKIKIKYGDIENHKVHRVMDLDLCKTLKTTENTITNCLKYQSLNKSKRIKCLMFTASLQKCSIMESFCKLDNILKEIGTKILPIFFTYKSSWTARDKHVFNEWEPVISKYGRLLVTDGLHIYTYKDGKKSYPMMTCLIMYR